MDIARAGSDRSEITTAHSDASSSSHSSKQLGLLPRIESQDAEDDAPIALSKGDSKATKVAEHASSHTGSSTAEDSVEDKQQPKNASTIVWSESFPKDKKGKGSSNGADDDDDNKSSSFVAPAQQKRKTFHMRGYDDDEETSWWFASTAVPLLAATLAPLANVLSIAALVTYWRMDLRDPTDPTKLVVEFSGVTYPDPHWCYWLNVVSLICGFIGNVFLLANFTGRIRYIIALPVTNVLWFIATGILCGITAAMNHYVPPQRPFETYSQGFWYAVIAAVLYLVCFVLLLLNMWGYFLGHYPQRFELNDHQRTLILQTMLFFIWLAGGGAVFSRIESRGTENTNWSFVDGLYFCDVTILTVGFGDLVLRNDLGRALIFPYTVGGIIMLGLVISSISKFAADMGQDKIVRKHFERVRTRTLEYSTMDKDDWEQRQKMRDEFSNPLSSTISAPLHELSHLVSRHHRRQPKPRQDSITSSRRASLIAPIRRRTNVREALKLRHHKVKLLREERDRFDEMRRLQRQTHRFKNYWALFLSLMAFALLWCIGAVVFWICERHVQSMSYFQALYFCYVSLLTIGYGDFAPQSNAGRSFFVVWSLIAVPTITLLINDMGSTVIESFKRGTFIAADFTVLLRKGVWADFLKSHPKIKAFVDERAQNKARKQRMREGLPVGDANITVTNLDEPDVEKTEDIDQDDAELDRLARETAADQVKAPSEARLANLLSAAIRRVAMDLHDDDKHYTFEEWAELTRLIRFTGLPAKQAQKEQSDDVVDWDWLGEESPMMANVSEPEFVMQKLCESLERNMKRMDRKVNDGIREIKRLQTKKEDGLGHHDRKKLS